MTLALFKLHGSDARQIVQNQSEALDLLRYIFLTPTFSLMPQYRSGKREY